MAGGRRRHFAGGEVSIDVTTTSVYATLTRTYLRHKMDDSEHGRGTPAAMMVRRRSARRRDDGAAT